MRKNFLLISLLVATTLSATDVNLSWYSSLVSPAGKPQTQIFDIQVNGSGDAFVLGHSGSINATDESTFLDTTFTGADYGTAGTSYNKNLVFTKVDMQGNLIWAVRSIDGDYSDGAFCATADGGAVLALKFRLSNRNQVKDQKSSYMTLVDATGKAYSLETTYAGSNFQHLVLVNITPSGEITKMTPLWAASVAPNGTGTNVAYITAVAQDEEGNLYFAGKQALDIAIGTDTLRAVHTGEWNGDMQHINDYSNSFIIKTDKDFNHMAHVTATGTVTADQIMKMSYKDGKLMVIGHILTAEAAKTFQLGGKEVAINDRSILVAQLDKNLSCAYIAPVQQAAAGSNKVVQLQQITWAEDGGSVFVVGGIQNGIVFNGTEIYAGGGTAPGKMYDGIIMHIDAATGNLMHAVFAGNTALNQHTGIVTFGKDTVLAVNYAMSCGGVKLYKYTADLQFVDNTQLASQGNMLNATATAARYKNTLLMTFCAKGGSNVTLADQTINHPTAWYNTLVAWTLPDVPGISTDAEAIITPSTDKAQKVIIDGKLYIRRGNQLFNALGQQM